MTDMFGNKNLNRNLLIDFSGYAFTIFYGAIVNDEQLTDEESQFNHWRYLMLQNFVDLKTKFKCNKVFIATDAGSWRSDVFEYYKAKRKMDRLKEPEKLEALFKAMGEFSDELDYMFHYNVMNVKKCEGDDNLAFMVYNLPKEEKKFIATGDKDMVQLMRVPNTKVWNIRKRDFLQCEDPETALIKLIMGGDTSDGIPNMKSDDDVFINSEKRQKACGVKGIEKILKSGLKECLMENTTWRKNFKRNEKLIRLDEKTIPVDKWQEMKKVFDSFDDKKGNPIEIGRYLTDRYLTGLMPRIHEFI